MFSASGWEVRAFGEEDPLRGCLLSGGFWHIQLWHPEGLSLLTPSRLTAFQFEAALPGERKHRATTYEALAEQLKQSSRITPPGPVLVSALQRWFVARVNTEFQRATKRSPHA